MIAVIIWTPDRIAAVALGAAALVFLWWYFFGPRKRAGVRGIAGLDSEGGGESVTITVLGGYDPEVVIAKKDVPLTLVFDRRESSPCTDEIVIPDLAIRQSLLAHGKTNIRIVPRVTGEYPFSCGMNMLHGLIRVVES